jgi:hypothetical protein
MPSTNTISATAAALVFSLDDTTSRQLLPTQFHPPSTSPPSTGDKPQSSNTLGFGSFIPFFGGITPPSLFFK